MGCCLTLRNELSEETLLLTKKKTVGKEHLVESTRVREPRRSALPHDFQSQVL